MLKMDLLRKFGEFLGVYLPVFWFHFSYGVHYSITALEQLQELACAPSVGLHDVPRESVGQHLGFGRDEGEGRDDLDVRLARRSTHVQLSLSY